MSFNLGNFISGSLFGGIFGGGAGSLLGGILGGSSGGSAPAPAPMPQLPKTPVTPDAMLADLRKRRSAMLQGNIAPIPTLLGGAQPQGPTKNTLLGD